MGISGVSQKHSSSPSEAGGAGAWQRPGKVHVRMCLGRGKGDSQQLSSKPVATAPVAISTVTVVTGISKAGRQAGMMRHGTTFLRDLDFTCSPTSLGKEKQRSVSESHLAYGKCLNASCHSPVPNINSILIFTATAVGPKQCGCGNDAQVGSGLGSTSVSATYGIWLLAIYFTSLFLSLPIFKGL